MEENKEKIEQLTKDYKSITPLKHPIILFICLGAIIIALASVILYFMVFYK